MTWPVDWAHFEPFVAGMACPCHTILAPLYWWMKMSWHWLCGVTQRLQRTSTELSRGKHPACGVVEGRHTLVFSVASYSIVQYLQWLTKLMQCMCCKDWSISLEPMMLMSWYKVGHVCGSFVYPPQLICYQQHVWLLRYLSIIATYSNIALVLWVTVHTHGMCCCAVPDTDVVPTTIYTTYAELFL